MLVDFWGNCVQSIQSDVIEACCDTDDTYEDDDYPLWVLVHGVRLDKEAGDDERWSEGYHQQEQSGICVLNWLLIHLGFVCGRAEAWDVGGSPFIIGVPDVDQSILLLRLTHYSWSNNILYKLILLNSIIL